MTDQPAEKRAAWDLESINPGLAQKAREALNSVRDPELGMTIVQLGLIRNIKLIDNQMIVSMILTTPYCPYGPALLEQARLAVETGTGLTTQIDLLLDPWDFSMMEDGAMPEWGIF